MIPREILKKIRQIELRTNQLVSQSAPGVRLCEPQHSSPLQSVENFDIAWPGEAALHSGVSVCVAQRPRSCAESCI